MSEPFVGEIRVVSWPYAPKNWALCNGAILPIQQNQALFALLGTTYGGDGVRTFALPDFRSRIALGAGPQTQMGAMSGQEAHTLSVAETPPHTHLLSAATNAGTAAPLTDGCAFAGFTNGYGPNPGPGGQTQLDPSDVTPAGANAPHENRQPFLCLNFIIALNGIFPSRN